MEKGTEQEDRTARVAKHTRTERFRQKFPFPHAGIPFKTRGKPFKNV